MYQILISFKFECPGTETKTEKNANKNICVFYRHVLNTADVRAFVITGSAGQHQGVKRITAFTGDRALESIRRMNELNNKVQGLISDVKNDDNTGTWETRYKEIMKVSIVILYIVS